MPDFEAFFAEHYEPVVRSLTIVLADRPSAEDAAQVGFERALRRWSTVGRLERPGTWVYVVAVRHGRHRLRRLEAAMPAYPGEHVGDAPDTAVVDAIWVAACVAKLPPRQRAAVVLRHLGGLRLAEIADALGVTVGTVKSSLHAAYGRLRVDMKEPSAVEEVGPHAR